MIIRVSDMMILIAKTGKSAKEVVAQEWEKLIESQKELGGAD